MKKYKVFVFIPKNFLDKVIDELKKFQINKIGNYINCMSWSEVHSTWTSLEGAKPYIGEPNKTTYEDEYKLEFLCNEDVISDVVKLLKKIHPYEEPEIDAVELKEIALD